MTAQTASYNAATQLQINLADPKNQIFSKADIVSIIAAVRATARLVPIPLHRHHPRLFRSNNPFLFINRKGRAMKTKQLYYMLHCAMVLLGVGFLGSHMAPISCMGAQAAQAVKLRADSRVATNLQTSLS